MSIDFKFELNQRTRAKFFLATLDSLFHCTHLWTSINGNDTWLQELRISLYELYQYESVIRDRSKIVQKISICASPFHLHKCVIFFSHSLFIKQRVSLVQLEVKDREESQEQW